MSSFPDSLPFEVVRATQQVEFEQKWLKLSTLEQQRLSSKMYVQILEYEQVVRYLELLYKQKDESLKLMARMASQDLARKQCANPCYLDQGVHDE